LGLAPQEKEEEEELHGGGGGGCRELSQDCFHIRYPTYLGLQLPTPPSKSSGCVGTSYRGLEVMKEEEETIQVSYSPLRQATAHLSRLDP